MRHPLPLIAIGTWTGAAGVGLAGSWGLLRYPGSAEYFTTPTQPAPSWLWQVGVVAAVVGGLFTALGLRSLRPSDLDPVTYRQARLFFVVVFAALDGAAITSVLVATESQLRWTPLFFAVIVTTFGWWGCRQRINPEDW